MAHGWTVAQNATTQGFQYTAPGHRNGQAGSLFHVHRGARFTRFAGLFRLVFSLRDIIAPSKTPKASSQCWAYMSSLAGATLRARARLKKEKSSSLYAHSPLSLWSCAAATAATAMGSPSVSVSHFTLVLRLVCEHTPDTARRLPAHCKTMYMGVRSGVCVNV